MVQQAPAAIDAGVFHNDVIAVGNRDFLMYHEHAFVDGQKVVQQLSTTAEEAGWQLYAICLSEAELPLPDAVRSYLFNSQLLSRPDGKMTLLCPLDTREVEASRLCTERILAEDNPVDRVEFLDLRQSMNNGGGPACLRLRVVLNDEELSSIHQGVLFDDALYSRLTDWVNRHYREELAPDDLQDTGLINEVNNAFVELATILELPVSVFGLQ